MAQASDHPFSQPEELLEIIRYWLPMPAEEIAESLGLKTGSAAYAAFREALETLRDEGALQAQGDNLLLAEGETKRREPRRQEAKPSFEQAASNGNVAAPPLLTNFSRAAERVARGTDPHDFSREEALNAGLSLEFPAEVLAEVAGMTVPSLEGRTDLRHIPFISADPKDAKDRDDIIFSQADTDPANPGGRYIITGIADVAHYVRPGSALDREARRRGNSTYFPDMVIPMLPEELSNGLCSLDVGQDRAIMATHQWIDSEGRLLRSFKERALAQPVANLSYEQLQEAYDGRPDAVTAPLVETVIKPLYETYRILARAREERGPLNLNIPEQRVALDEAGKMTGIYTPERLDSHRLIEEFMILANTATLPVYIFRIHDIPDPEKMEAVAEIFAEYGIRFPRTEISHPSQLKEVLERAAAHPASEILQNLLLRATPKAIYSSHNIGHFGLALPDGYGHRTSPIRRYADLINQRLDIRDMGAGPDSMPDEEMGLLEEISAHITGTEIRSARAERAAVARFATAWIAESGQKQQTGRIVNIISGGIFVRLEGGVDGFIPKSKLPKDYYFHNKEEGVLTGKRNGISYRIGSPITVNVLGTDVQQGHVTLAPTDRKGADFLADHRAANDNDAAGHAAKSHRRRGGPQPE